MKVASRTHPGRVRETNEDSLFTDDRLGLLVLADGMGGHRGGAVASKIAVETISASLREGLPGQHTPEAIDRLIGSGYWANGVTSQWLRP